MKYFIILLILTLTIISCGKNDYRSEGGDYVNYVQFRGHGYITFHSIHAYGYAVLHDPGCNCKKGGEE